MSVFSIFRKKNNSNELELIVPLPKEKKLILRSSDLYKLSVNNVIDTLDEEVVAKYISNVHLLRNTLKEKKTPGTLAIIRNDDFFPEDFVWQENSSETYGEFISIPLSYSLREELAKEKLGVNEQSFGFAIPGLYDEEKLNEEMRRTRTVGNIYAPVKFRTTKHFTINTPLGYTGEYNQVDSNRKYTIIDKADALINSPYTYSISGRDAYLDVTHEGLPVSSDAIILISDEYFNEIKDDKELMELLNRRKLMVYRGDINTAINMILTENSILPFKPGHGIEYDYELGDITEAKLKEISESHGYEYDKGHGNMFGTGGHFTDLIDRRYALKNNGYVSSLAGFLNLNCDLPYEIEDYMLLKEDTASKIVKDIGAHRLLDLINSYNINMINVMNERRNAYLQSRSDIDPSTKELFRNTVMLIKRYFQENENASQEVWDNIYNFYTSSDIDTQVSYAQLINEDLKEYANNFR